MIAVWSPLAPSIALEAPKALLPWRILKDQRLILIVDGQVINPKAPQGKLAQLFVFKVSETLSCGRCRLSATGNCQPPHFSAVDQFHLYFLKGQIDTLESQNLSCKKSLVSCGLCF